MFRCDDDDLYDPTHFETLQTQMVDESRLQLKGVLSKVEDLDYAEAVTRMQKELLALEAAQSSFANISRLSLFDYLR